MVQESDYKSMRLDCSNKATLQRILALNSRCLGSQRFVVSEFLLQRSVLEILRLVNERVEEIEELNIISAY